MSDLLPAPLPMTRDEARACIESMHRSVEHFRAKACELHEREGWKALDYETWGECVAAEFDQGRNYIYRQLAAALIEREVLPMGNIGAIPERQLRPLLQIPAGERKPVWEHAVASAPNGKPTARHVEAAVAHVNGNGKVRSIPVHAELLIEDDPAGQEAAEADEPDEESGQVDSDQAERRSRRFLESLDRVDALTRAVDARICHDGYDGLPAILTHLGRQDSLRVKGKTEILIERLQGWLASIKEGLR